MPPPPSEGTQYVRPPSPYIGGGGEYYMSLSSLIGMSSIPPSRNVLYLLIGMSDKEEDGEAVLGAIGSTQSRSPYIPCL